MKKDFDELWSKVNTLEWDNKQTQIRICPECKHRTFQYRNTIPYSHDYLMQYWECLTCGTHLHEAMAKINDKDLSS